MVCHMEFIGASLSEPHTNQYYKKTAVLMYVGIYVVAIHQTCSPAHIIIAVKIINVGRVLSPKDAARIHSIE